MHITYPNVLDESFDEDNIDWNMYKKVEYMRMLNYTIDRFSPSDFFLDDDKVIRNRVFQTGRTPHRTHYFLGTLDLGYECMWIFNSALPSLAKERYIEYMEGVWVPRNCTLLPTKDGSKIAEHVGWNRFREELFGPGATCNGWKNWRDAPGYKELDESN